MYACCVVATSSAWQHNGSGAGCLKQSGKSTVMKNSLPYLAWSGFDLLRAVADPTIQFQGRARSVAFATRVIRVLLRIFYIDSLRGARW